MHLIVRHIEAAVKAVVVWWSSMSDVEKRQTQHRAMTIGACAAAFAIAGPLIGQRFDVQKTEEAYRAEAVQLAQSLGGGGPQVAQHVSFSNKAAPTALFQSVSFNFSTVAGPATGYIAAAEQDSMVRRGLATFSTENLGVIENEQAEMDCLAQAVYYEARSEDLKGQMAVAEVVMNRVKSPHFPKSVCEVVYQGRYRDTGCQFTFTCDGSLRNPPSGDAWERARAVALHVAMGLNTPVTNNATHYHTDYVNPYWRAGLVETATIGTHIFYRFPKTNAEWTTARIALAAQNGGSVSDEALAIPVEIDGIEIQPPVNDADKLAAAALVKISTEVKPATEAQPVAALAPATIQPIQAASAAPDARPL
ncbi:MAG TPA: cell wall hydrolase [Hyphomonadaceae bacterium]|nr:cell wall hydrolase [Hyphomonadaceae bacterium]